MVEDTSEVRKETAEVAMRQSLISASVGYLDPEIYNHFGCRKGQKKPALG
jgi:hypothetical protein